MAPGSDSSPVCGVEFENGVFKDNKSIPIIEEENHEEYDNSNQAKPGRPPRNLPVMRHCNSQAILERTSKLVGKSLIFNPHFPFCDMRSFTWLNDVGSSTYKVRVLACPRM